MKAKNVWTRITEKLFRQRAVETLATGSVDRGKLPMLINWFWNPKLGVPRGVNISVLRMFGNSVWVRQCVDTIIEEIANMNWDMVPTEAYEENYDEDRKNFIKDFFSNPNKDEDFVVFLKKLLEDILILDAGIIVKTFTKDSYNTEKSYNYEYDFTNIKGTLVSVNETVKSKPFKTDNEITQLNKLTKTRLNKALGKEVKNSPLHLTEMYVADGGSVAVATDKHGRLYEDKPTFWQYSFQHPAGAPLGFWRREICYFRMNPRTVSYYGWSNVQTTMQILEALNNAVRFNKIFFEENALPDGIIDVEGISQEDLKAMKEQWKNELKGKDHKILFSNAKINWTAFTKSSREMEWLDGQKFYQKLIMSLFHITQTELGFTDEANKHSSGVQDTTFIRKCIKPITKMIESIFNRQIVPEFYLDKEAPECEFKFFINDEAKEQQQKMNDKIDLELGLLTVNEVRRERGLEDVEWGDEPLRRPMSEMNFNMAQNPFGNNPKEKEKEKKEEKSIKKNIIPESGYGPKAKDYEEFLNKYYDNIEKSLLNAVPDIKKTYDAIERIEKGTKIEEEIKPTPAIDSVNKSESLKKNKVKK